MEQRKRILEKIKKLMALAGSSNAHEAGLAALRAKQLLEKYNLTICDLDSFKENSQVTQSKMKTTRKLEPWAWLLSDEVSIKFNTQFSHNRYSGSSSFYGVSPDPEVSVYVFEFLYATIKRMATEYIKEDRIAQLPRSEKVVARKLFSMGAVSAVGKVLDRYSPPPVVEANEKALMCVKEQMVTEFMEDQNFAQKEIKSKVVDDGISFLVGNQRASRLNIRKSIE